MKKIGKRMSDENFYIAIFNLKIFKIRTILDLNHFYLV